MTTILTDSNTDSKSSKSRGWMFFLLKIVLFSAFVFLLEKVLAGTMYSHYTNDSVLKIFKPYQNSYISSNPFFMVIQNLGNDYSGETSAFFRFFVSLLVIAPIFLLSSILVVVIKPLLKFQKLITNSLLFLLMTVGAYVALCVPNTKTTFDDKNRQLIITTRTLFVIPESVIIPYNAIPEIRYEYISGYYFMEREYNYYLSYYINYQGRKIILGDRDTGYVSKQEIKNNDWRAPEKLEKEAEATVNLLNKIIAAK